MMTFVLLSAESRIASDTGKVCGVNRWGQPLEPCTTNVLRATMRSPPCKRSETFGLGMNIYIYTCVPGPLPIFGLDLKEFSYP